MTSTTIKKHGRRSSCGTITLVASAATAVAMSSTSAFTHCYHESVLRRSSTALSLSSIGSNKRVLSILDRSLDLIDNPSVKEHSNYNTYFDQEKNANDDNDDNDNNELEHRPYDDEIKNTIETETPVIVQVIGSSELDTPKIMISAHKTGFVTTCSVGNKHCFKMAELYRKKYKSNLAFRHCPCHYW